MLATASAAAAQTPGAEWIQLARGRYQVYTNAGVRSARATLAALGHMERAYAALHQELPARTPPVRVYLFRGENEFRRFRMGEYSRGFYQSGPDFDAIVLVAGGEEALRAARHEFVHLASHRTLGPLPGWLEEGLAEVYSTLSVSGERGAIGRAIPAHVERLQREESSGFEWILEVEADPALASSAALVNRYYALCWAVTHLLRIQPPYSNQFDELLAALAAGEPAAEAFPRVFGHSLAQTLAEARAAARAGRFAVLRVAMPPAPQEVESEPRAMSREEIDHALAELMVAAGRREDAEELYRTTAERSPKDAEAASGLGLLALRMGNYDEARMHLKRAIELGSRSASTFFEYAVLLRDTGGPEEEVTRWLRRTVEVNPAHPEAWFLLASGEERRGRLQEAVALYERASSILPRQFLFREALARAYMQQGRREAALEQARVALQCARSSRERAMAEGLLKELQRPVETPPAGRAPVTTPESWTMPAAESRAEGTLARVECGKALVFHVETARGPLALAAEPGQLRTKGAPREVVCGPAAGRPAVIVEYRAEGEGRGRLATIEFK